jgi:serine/threonine protein kinase
MPKTRKVIGEGSYGCVQDPSLHCTHIPKPNFDYNGYVSKLMKTKRAEEELAEFVKFHRYDPNDEYHLGTPIMCKPNLQEAGVMADVEQCKKMSPDVKAKPADYDLLVMKYGGPDLKIFCKSKINQFLKTKKEEKSDKFWLEVHHLIKGLQFFRDSGIVHNDLKPQNILYDTKTNKLMFIDFGLMQTKREIIRTSKNNTNNQAVFHWSYPLDSGFMDYNAYSKWFGILWWLCVSSAWLWIQHWRTGVWSRWKLSKLQCSCICKGMGSKVVCIEIRYNFGFVCCRNDLGK